MYNFECKFEYFFHQWPLDIKAALTDFYFILPRGGNRTSWKYYTDKQVLSPYEWWSAYFSYAADTEQHQHSLEKSFQLWVGLYKPLKKISRSLAVKCGPRNYVYQLVANSVWAGSVEVALSELICWPKLPAAGNKADENELK